MGYITFLGTLRRGKSSHQITLTVPKKFKDIVSIDKLVFVKISNTRNDMKSGESIHFDAEEKSL